MANGRCPRPACGQPIYYRGSVYCKAHRLEFERSRKAWLTPRFLAWSRQYKFRRKYGITIAESEEILAAQGGVCDICQRVPERPCMDHDHTTGALRGVLCHRCNSALGMMGDSLETVERAAAYLKKAQRVLA